MSHRKWRETKQKLIWWPDQALLGCSLVSLHFQCDILAPITVLLGRPFMTLPSPFTVLLSSSLSIEALGNLRHFWRPTCFSLLSIALSRLWRSLKPYLVKNSGNGTRERKFFSFADRSLLNVFDKKISFLQTHMQTGCFFRHTTYCVCVATSYRVTRQVDY